MSLSTKFQVATASKRKPCKLGSLLAGKLMPEEDKKELLRILSIEQGDPNRIPNTVITKVLNDEGYEIGISTIERHRINMCSCYKGRGK